MLSSARRPIRTSPPTFCRRRLFHRVPLLDDLAYRGFLHDVTRFSTTLPCILHPSTNARYRPDALAQALQSKPLTVYSGVDPTASSLHIGHLIPFMALLHFQARGHRIIPLVRFPRIVHTPDFTPGPDRWCHWPSGRSFWKAHRTSTGRSPTGR
jgi:tyrosyl-tRNA synthetase